MTLSRPHAREWLSTEWKEAPILPKPAARVESPPLNPNPFSGRLAEAFALALELHGAQVRKGTVIPYLTHLMAVAALVGEHGGGEDEMIGALLHDAAEDCGGKVTLDRIREAFGEAVAAIVGGCSDDLSGGEKAPWAVRKTAYLRHLVEAPMPTLRVSCADKLHNARAIVTDLQNQGPNTLNRFQGGKVGTLWYYRSLSEIYLAILKDEGDEAFEALAAALARTVKDMETLAHTPITRSRRWTPASGRARTQRLLEILNKPASESEPA